MIERKHFYETLPRIYSENYFYFRREIFEQLIQDFNKRFDDTDLRAVRSPLRICPIGAHSDFQGGRVTGMTINASVDMVYAPREDGYIIVHSLDFPDKKYFHLSHESDYVPGFWGNCQGQYKIVGL